MATSQTRQRLLTPRTSAEGPLEATGFWADADWRDRIIGVWDWRVGITLTAGRVSQWRDARGNQPWTPTPLLAYPSATPGPTYDAARGVRLGPGALLVGANCSQHTSKVDPVGLLLIWRTPSAFASGGDLGALVQAHDVPTASLTTRRNTWAVGNQLVRQVIAPNNASGGFWTGVLGKSVQGDGGVAASVTRSGLLMTSPRLALTQRLPRVTSPDSATVHETALLVESIGYPPAPQVQAGGATLSPANTNRVASGTLAAQSGQLQLILGGIGGNQNGLPQPDAADAYIALACVYRGFLTPADRAALLPRLISAYGVELLP